MINNTKLNAQEEVYIRENGDILDTYFKHLANLGTQNTREFISDNGFHGFIFSFTSDVPCQDSSLIIEGLKNIGYKNSSSSCYKINRLNVTKFNIPLKRYPLGSSTSTDEEILSRLDSVDSKSSKGSRGPNRPIHQNDRFNWTTRPHFTERPRTLDSFSSQYDDYQIKEARRNQVGYSTPPPKCPQCTSIPETTSQISTQSQSVDNQKDTIYKHLYKLEVSSCLIESYDSTRFKFNFYQNLSDEEASSIIQELKSIGFKSERLCSNSLIIFMNKNTSQTSESTNNNVYNNNENHSLEDEYKNCAEEIYEYLVSVKIKPKPTPSYNELKNAFEIIIHEKFLINSPSHLAVNLTDALNKIDFFILEAEQTTSKSKKFFIAPKRETINENISNTQNPQVLYPLQGQSAGVMEIGRAIYSQLLKIRNKNFVESISFSETLKQFTVSAWKHLLQPNNYDINHEEIAEKLKEMGFKTIVEKEDLVSNTQSYIVIVKSMIDSTNQGCVNDGLSINLEHISDWDFYHDFQNVILETINRENPMLVSEVEEILDRVASALSDQIWGPIYYHETSHSYSLVLWITSETEEKAILDGLCKGDFEVNVSPVSLEKNSTTFIIKSRQ